MCVNNSFLAKASYALSVVKTTKSVCFLLATGYSFIMRSHYRPPAIARPRSFCILSCRHRRRCRHCNDTTAAAGRLSDRTNTNRRPLPTQLKARRCWCWCRRRRGAKLSVTLMPGQGWRQYGGGRTYVRCVKFISRRDMTWILYDNDIWFACSTSVRFFSRLDYINPDRLKKAARRTSVWCQK